VCRCCVPVPASDDHGRRGDLIVGVEVSTPTRLDDEQVALLSQLAKVRGEEGVGGVARLRLPEKVARTLHESELPVLADVEQVTRNVRP